MPNWDTGFQILMPIKTVKSKTPPDLAPAHPGRTETTCSSVSATVSLRVK